MPSAQLTRARRFSIPAAKVSSTIWGSSKRSRSRAKSSSGTSTGVRLIPSAYSSTSFSSSSKSSDSRKDGIARSCSSLMPSPRASQEP